MSHKDHVPEKGVADGLATLDSNTLVPVPQLPTMVGAGTGDGERGTVPQPVVGDGTKVLFGDGTWSSLSVFGTEFVTAEETTALVSTLLAFVEHHTLALTNIAAGDYFIQWFYVWSHDAPTSDFEGRVQINDTIDLIDPDNGGIHKNEAKDAGGGGIGGTTQRYPSQGHRIVTLTAGDHDIDIDFRTDLAGVNSTIYHSVITVWRVS